MTRPLDVVQEKPDDRTEQREPKIEATPPVVTDNGELARWMEWQTSFSSASRFS